MQIFSIVIGACCIVGGSVFLGFLIHDIIERFERATIARRINPSAPLFERTSLILAPCFLIVIIAGALLIDAQF